MDHDAATLDKEAERIVRTIGIPPCPEALTKILRAMREDDPDFRKIGSLIGTDVGLAAAMVKTVNSPFYGLRKKATSVQQALALLGLRNAAQLVTGLLLREAFAGAHATGMDQFWEFSSSIALVTTWLAPRIKGVNHENAYTFALFRDCGIAALVMAFKDYKPNLYGASADEPAFVLAKEKRNFGVDHCIMGYKLARTWSLPDETCQAVLYHHDFEGLMSGGTFIPDVSVQLIALGLVAEWLFTMHREGSSSPEWMEAGAFALEKLSITQAQLDEFLPEIKDVLSA